MVHERVVEDIYLYDITPASPAKSQRDQEEHGQQRKTKRIYYYAGGGWQMPAGSDHWKFTTEIAAQLHVVVTIVSYPLAPNSPAPTSFAHLLRLHTTLLADAARADEDVVVMGDSAGGNIALCLLTNSLLYDPECAVPKAVMVVCPSTDLRRENAEMRRIEARDPLLRLAFVKQTADAWRGEWDAEDVRVSPLFASLEVVGKRGVHVHGVTGRYDILSPDAVLFREKCEQAGVEGEWLDWDKQMHCFPLAFSYKLRESVEAKDWVLDVLRRV
jgi:acetyl esterase/lipase